METPKNVFVKQYTVREVKNGSTQYTSTQGKNIPKLDPNGPY